MSIIEQKLKKSKNMRKIKEYTVLIANTTICRKATSPELQDLMQALLSNNGHVRACLIIKYYDMKERAMKYNKYLITSEPNKIPIAI